MRNLIGTLQYRYVAIPPPRGKQHRALPAALIPSTPAGRRTRTSTRILTMIHRMLANVNELIIEERTKSKEQRAKNKEQRTISELRKGLYARTTQLLRLFHIRESDDLQTTKFRRWRLPPPYSTAVKSILHYYTFFISNREKGSQAFQSDGRQNRFPLAHAGERPWIMEIADLPR